MACPPETSVAGLGRHDQPNRYAVVNSLWDKAGLGQFNQYVDVNFLSDPVQQAQPVRSGKYPVGPGLSGFSKSQKFRVGLCVAGFDRLDQPNRYAAVNILSDPDFPGFQNHRNSGWTTKDTMAVPFDQATPVFPCTKLPYPCDDLYRKSLLHQCFGIGLEFCRDWPGGDS